MSIIPAQMRSKKEPPKALTDQLFDLLSRTTYGTAGGVRAALRGEDILPAAWSGLKGETKSTWSDVFGDLGMEEGPLRTGLGIAGDVVLDPSNVLLPLAAGKVAKLAGKAAGAVKATKGFQKLAENRPLLQKLAYPLPKEYRDLKSIMISKGQAGENIAVQQAMKRLGGLDVKDRALVLRAMETGEDLGPRLNPVVAKEKQIMLEQGLKEKKVGLLESMLQDYAPRVWVTPKKGGMPFIRDVSAKSKFNIQREFKTLDEAIAHGAAPDVLVASGKRLAAGNKSISRAEFLDDLVKKGDIAKPVGNAPAGWRQAAIAAEDPIKKKISKYAFPEEIARDLERVFMPSAADGSFMQGYDQILAIWKTWTTATRPGFHARNFLSNNYNMWLSGMKPRDFAIAFEGVVGGDANKFIPAIGMTKNEFLKLAGTLGIRGTGHGAFQELTRTIEQEAKYAAKGVVGKTISKVNPLSEQFPLIQLGRKLGQRVEDSSRSLLFFDRLRKGDDPYKAALTVKKYLFNYQELADWEKKYLRRVIPFYTWLRNNIPLQIESTLLHPEKLRKVGAVYKGLEREGEKQSGKVSEVEKPGWFRDVGGMIRWPLGKAKAFINPGLPFLDLNRLGIPNASVGENIAKLPREFASVLTPGIKLPLELGGNRNFYTGRELWNRDVGPSDMQPAPDIVKLLPAFGIPLEAFGIQLRREKDGRQRYYMPAAAGYLLSQSLPNLIQMGKMDIIPGTSIDKTPPSELVFGKLKPSTVGTIAGVRPFILTPKQARQNKLEVKRSAKRGATRVRKGANKALPQPPSVLDWIQENLQ